MDDREITVTDALTLCEKKGKRWLPNGHRLTLPDNEAEIVEIVESGEVHCPYTAKYRYSSEGTVWERQLRPDSLVVVE